MIARIARGGGVVAASAILILSAQATALAAEGGTPAPLTLDKTFTGVSGKTIDDQPASLRDCRQFPEGAKKATDGWRFDQPVAGAQPLAYTVAFIETVDGKASPVLIGLIAGRLLQIDVNEETLKGNISQDDLEAAPAGVSGGLVDGGAWLGTPHGWRLATGALMIDGDAGGVTTFSLTAVCPPPASPSPTTSTTRSASSSPAVAHSPSTSATTEPAAVGLAITGNRSGTVALLGLTAVALGVLMLAARRRRAKIRFRA